jgi:hypothetical protein
MQKEPDKRFELWRQDDNGNRFKVAGFDRLADAENKLAELTSSPHKQIYWIEKPPIETSK